MNATTSTPDTIKYNRKQYMNRECTHQEYYAQFVTKAVLSTVSSAFTVKQLQDGKDEAFNNTTALSSWDRLSWGGRSEALLAESNASMYAPNQQHIRAVSLSDKVCVMKAAGRMIAENPELTK